MSVTGVSECVMNVEYVWCAMNTTMWWAFVESDDYCRKTVVNTLSVMNFVEFESECDEFIVKDKICDECDE